MLASAQAKLLCVPLAIRAMQTLNRVGHQSQQGRFADNHGDCTAGGMIDPLYNMLIIIKSIRAMQNHLQPSWKVTQQIISSQASSATRA